MLTCSIILSSNAGFPGGFLGGCLLLTLLCLCWALQQLLATQADPFARMQNRLGSDLLCSMTEDNTHELCSTGVKCGLPESDQICKLMLGLHFWA